MGVPRSRDAPAPDDSGVKVFVVIGLLFAAVLLAGADHNTSTVDDVDVTGTVDAETLLAGHCAAFVADHHEQFPAGDGTIGSTRNGHALALHLFDDFARAAHQPPAGHTTRSWGALLTSVHHQLDNAARLHRNLVDRTVAAGAGDTHTRDHPLFLDQQFLVTVLALEAFDAKFGFECLGAIRP